MLPVVFRRRCARAVIVVIVVGLAGTGCGSKPAPEVSDGIPASELPSPDIDLAPEAVVVAGRGGETVRSISGDGTALTLDGSVPGVQALRAGQVLLLSGVAVVKVARVEHVGADVVVHAEPAEITDLIKNGRLTWNDTVMRDGSVTSWEGGADEVETEVPAVAMFARPHFQTVAQHSLADKVKDTLNTKAKGLIEGKIGSWGWESSVTPSANGATTYHYAITQKAKKALTMRGSLDATIDPLTTAGDITVGDGVLSTMKIYVNNLSGRLKLSLDAGTGEDIARFPITKLKMPVSVDFPFTIYGIPFNASVSGTFLVEPHFTSKNSTVGATAEITFGGPVGLSFDKGSLTANGDIKQHQVGTPISSVSGIAIGGVGFVFASQFPKLQVGLGTSSKLMGGPYLSLVTSFGVTLAPALGMVACKQFTVVSTLTAGIGIQVPGVKIPDLKKVEIGKKQSTDFTPKVHACEPK